MRDVVYVVLVNNQPVAYFRDERDAVNTASMVNGRAVEVEEYGDPRDFQQTQERKRIRAGAIAKLSPEEREVLGIRD